MTLFEKCRNFTKADELKAVGLYPYFRLVETGQDTEVRVDGHPVLMLGSNSYLGLTNHPHVKRRAIEALEQFGTGCAGSRFLNGTLPIHLELEERLAALVGKPAALVFSTGYQTNLGTISALVLKGDVTVCDKLDHACIIDGGLLAPGEMLRYRHNDTEHLAAILRDLPAGSGRLVVTDGVFSMEGDICRLPEIVRIAREHDAQVLVDDAHGIGVLGPRGAGTAAHFGLTDETDLIMGTFSKSLASTGGFIAAERDVINYLKHHSRAFIFSAAAPPAAVGAVLGALDVMEREPERFDRLWENTRFLKSSLDALGFQTGPSETPIIPVLAGELEQCFAVCGWLHDRGVFINPVVPPAVPPGRTLIRLSVTAGHTRAQLERAVDTIEKAGRHFGLI
ncbi:MAG: aminotransferase class I/II-fold pyridoxal phosphate-dependent enzyme [Acidobacteria bacterium]|nr:aminotransferase class I/II-fold pyridoxal phosphate-dependent enzyme [Acidobacteriota bacterium]